MKNMHFGCMGPSCLWGHCRAMRRMDATTQGPEKPSGQWLSPSLKRHACMGLNAGSTAHLPWGLRVQLPSLSLPLSQKQGLKR